MIPENNSETKTVSRQLFHVERAMTDGADRTRCFT